MVQALKQNDRLRSRNSAISTRSPLHLSVRKSSDDQVLHTAQPVITYYVSAAEVSAELETLSQELTTRVSFEIRQPWSINASVVNLVQ